MSVRIRLARGGTKKRPFYRIVATSSRTARDGRFLEKLGSYNPLLPSDSPERVVLQEERIRYWLGVGAQPSDRVARFLDNAGITESATRWRGTGKRAEAIAAKKAEAAAAAEAVAATEAEAKAKAAAEAKAKAAAEAEAKAAAETEAKAAAEAEAKAAAEAEAKAAAEAEAPAESAAEPVAAESPTEAAKDDSA